MVSCSVSTWPRREYAYDRFEKDEKKTKGQKIRNNPLRKLVIAPS